MTPNSGPIKHFLLASDFDQTLSFNVPRRHRVSPGFLVHAQPVVAADLLVLSAAAWTARARTTT